MKKFRFAETGIFMADNDWRYARYCAYLEGAPDCKPVPAAILRDEPAVLLRIRLRDALPTERSTG